MNLRMLLLNLSLLCLIAGAVSKPALSSDYSTEQLETDEGDVLPKMSLEIDAPSSITILDKRMPYKATAKYIYGQSVWGTVTVRVCRPPILYYLENPGKRNPGSICAYNTGDLDSNGTFNGDLDLTPFQLDRSGNQMALTMQLTVTVEGTGVQMTESKYISITSKLATASFNRNIMSPYYKQGLPYHVEILVKDSVGKPLANQPVELQLNGLTPQNLTTDGNGTAQYDLQTSDLVDSSLNIQAIYKNPVQCFDSNCVVPNYGYDFYTITRLYSRIDSFIQIQNPQKDLQCGQTYDLNIQYSFGKDSLKEGETTANFIHIVTSGSKILSIGEHPIDVTASAASASSVQDSPPVADVDGQVAMESVPTNRVASVSAGVQPADASEIPGPSGSALKGEFTISLEVTSDLAPDAQLIVYYMSTQELVADAAHLSIEKCFNNQFE